MAEVTTFLTEQLTPRNALIAGATIASAVAIRNLLKTKPEQPSGENCFDIVHDLDDRIRRVSDVSYFVAGGVSAAALKNPRTYIDVVGEAILPPQDVFKAQYRENGTLGDLDLIVLTSDDEELDKIRRALTPLSDDDEELKKPGAKLKIGVTGLKTAPEEKSSKGTFKEGFVSDRVQHPDGSITWEIVDITQRLSSLSLHPWKLQLPSGGTVPVMHPVMQMICYGARTGHGIRKRDVEKLEEMEKVIGPAFDVKLEWVDGRRKVAVGKASNTATSFDEAAEFLMNKNEQLSYEQMVARLGKKRAVFLAAKIAIHRHVDTHDFYERFGQSGPIFDLFLSRITGELQHALTTTSK